MVNRNPLSSLKLGHARGVVLLAATHAGLGVHEYAAKQVKRAVTGTGNAAKEQVAMMVRFLLPGSARSWPMRPTRWRSRSATPISAPAGPRSPPSSQRDAAGRA